MNTDQIEKIKRGDLKPCPFNPRKHFDEGKLDDLGVNIRGPQGIINPLTVRITPRGTEIVCGECRWRASGERTHPVSGVKLPAIEELPVLFRALSDIEALELMLSENMQRADLTPLEECDAFARALGEKKDGKLIHTQATLAEKIGVGEDVISSRLALRKLPKNGRAAVEAGTLSYRVARRVCAAPAALVPKLMEALLNEKKFPIDRWPRHHGDAMTVEDVEKLMAHMSARIADAPFALDDERLVPQKSDSATGERIEGGACKGCEFNSATAAPMMAREQARCMNAACFRHKVEIHVASALVKAKADGATLLKDSEAEKVMGRGLFGVNANYVDLDAKLDPDDRAQDVSDRAAPTWAKIVQDKDGKPAVPVFVAVDKQGNVRRFAERAVACEAAQKLGTAKSLSLGGGRGKSLDQSERRDDEKKRRAEEIAAQKMKTATSFALAGLLVAAVEKDGVEDLFDVLLPLALRHAGNGGASYVCKRRGIETKPDVDKALSREATKMTPDQLNGLIVELLVAQDLAGCCGQYSTSVVPDFAKPLLKFYKVALDDAKAAAKEELAAKVKPKKDLPSADGKGVEKASDEWGPWLKWSELLPAQRTEANGKLKELTAAQLAGKEFRFAADAKGLPVLRDSRNAQPAARPAKAKKA